MKTGKILSRVLAIAVCAAAVYVLPSLCTKGLPIPPVLRATLPFVFVSFCLVLWGIEAKMAKPKVTVAKKVKSNFDWGMHYFRAFAIIAIMACHYAAGNGYPNTNNIFFTASTFYFLFISGYLCQYLDTKRRDAPLVYYRKKLTNVICPFVIFSILFAIMKGAFDVSSAFLNDLVLGRVQGQYWYIPFVSILFLVSPWLCRMGNRNIVLTLVISVFFFIVFPIRPAGSFTFRWPNFLYFYTYFTFYYILGFVYCRFKPDIDVQLNRYWYLFAVGALMMYVAIWNPPCLHLSWGSLGVMVCLQRFMTLACALVLLSKIKDKKIRILDLFAKYSFTLYFVHFAVYVQMPWIRTTLLRYLPLPTLIAESCVFIILICGMLMVAIILKTAFGKYSRSLMGT